MTILLTGATGEVGRRAAARLDDLGVPARQAGRTSSPPFDWTDDATWPAALDGVRSAFVVPYDAAPLTRPFVDAAIRSGVERIVLLSGRGVDVADYLPADLMEGNPHIDGEAALRPAAVDWTILRPGWFAQNFSEGFFRDAVLAGDLRLPAGDGATSFVDADDIAAVAVAALTEDRHVGQTYELSGPRALTMAEVAAEIAAASGRDVRYTMSRTTTSCASWWVRAGPRTTPRGTRSWSARSAAASTRTSPTVSSAPSAARPATSATSSGRLRKPGPGPDLPGRSAPPVELVPARVPLRLPHRRRPAAEVDVDVALLPAVGEALRAPDRARRSGVGRRRPGGRPAAVRSGADWADVVSRLPAANAAMNPAVARRDLRRMCHSKIGDTDATTLRSRHFRDASRPLHDVVRPAHAVGRRARRDVRLGRGRGRGRGTPRRRRPRVVENVEDERRPDHVEGRVGELQPLGVHHQGVGRRKRPPKPRDHGRGRVDGGHRAPGSQRRQRAASGAEVEEPRPRSELQRGHEPLTGPAEERQHPVIVAGDEVEHPPGGLVGHGHSLSAVAP